ncbi:MAG TPA: hypothetical protein VGH28_09465 [Polyangiaceae bacterium]|jgi:hypothetical protein
MGGLRALNTVLLVAVFALLLASGTQREKSVLARGHEDTVRGLEARYAMRHDAASMKDLAQAYLDASAPGLAVAAIEGAPDDVRHDVYVEHTYARALIDSGRASDALVAEQRVLDACDKQGCDAWLLASAMRRSDILRELEKLGIDDAQAHPESAAVAYHAATREARLSIQ